MVLFGDEHQLQPTVTSPEARAWGLSVSILAKLKASMGSSENYNVTLTQCHRMHPSLLIFPSCTYYEGRLRPGLLHPATDRPSAVGLPFRPMRRLTDTEEATLRRNDLDQGTKVLDPTGGVRTSPSYTQDGDLHRLLVAHVDSHETQSDHAEGYVNQ